MRKRSILNLADTLFWYLIYLLPVLMYLLNGINHDVTAFESFMTTTLGFAFTSDNVVYVALTALLGVDGIVPLFSSNAPLLMVTCFASMVLVHLFVDFIVFIPRLCHKWLGKMTTEG